MGCSVPNHFFHAQLVLSQILLPLRMQLPELEKHLDEHQGVRRRGGGAALHPRSFSIMRKPRDETHSHTPGCDQRGQRGGIVLLRIRDLFKRDTSTQLSSHEQSSLGCPRWRNASPENNNNNAEYLFMLSLSPTALNGSLQPLLFHRHIQLSRFKQQSHLWNPSWLMK